MNPLPTFFELLREAHSASEAVDAFDLNSDDQVSVDAWNVLLARQHEAGVALVRYCNEYAISIEAALIRSRIP